LIKKHISNKGKITGICTDWAIPVEEEKIIMDQLNTERGWIPTLILYAANLMR
jgi:hypothetical protein